MRAFFSRSSASSASSKPVTTSVSVSTSKASVSSASPVTTSPKVSTPVAPTYTWTGPYVPSSGFTSTVITEANHTETVPIPIISYATSGASFSSLATTEASHTETVPVPVAPATTAKAVSGTAVTSAVAVGTGASSRLTGATNGTATYTTPAPAHYTGSGSVVAPALALLAALGFLQAMM
jgi:hypothetical protein